MNRKTFIIRFIKRCLHRGSVIEQIRTKTVLYTKHLDVNVARGMHEVSKRVRTTVRDTNIVIFFHILTTRYVAVVVVDINFASTRVRLSVQLERRVLSRGRQDVFLTRSGDGLEGLLNEVLRISTVARILVCDMGSESVGIVAKVVIFQTMIESFGVLLEVGSRCEMRVEEVLRDP